MTRRDGIVGTGECGQCGAIVRTTSDDWAAHRERCRVPRGWHRLGLSEWIDGRLGLAFGRVFASGDAWVWEVYGAALQGRPVAHGAGSSASIAKHAAEEALEAFIGREDVGKEPGDAKPGTTAASAPEAQQGSGAMTGEWTLKAARARSATVQHKTETMDIAQEQAVSILFAVKDRAQLIALVDRMREYLTHDPGCPPAAGAACDCGLAELTSEIDAGGGR